MLNPPSFYRKLMRRPMVSRPPGVLYIENRFKSRSRHSQLSPRRSGRPFRPFGALNGKIGVFGGDWSVVAGLALVSPDLGLLLGGRPFIVTGTIGGSGIAAYGTGPDAAAGDECLRWPVVLRARWVSLEGELWRRFPDDQGLEESAQGCCFGR